MIVNRRSLYSAVVRATRSELAWLEQRLTYSQGNGRTATHVCHLKTADNGTRFFPSGFIRSLLRDAATAGMSFQVDDKRTSPGAVAPIARVLKKRRPWFYQYECATTMLRAGNGAVKLPTGSGKTLVVVLAINAMRGMRVLYCVSDAVLASKTAETIEEETGIKVARKLGGGDVVSTTLQRIYSAMVRDPVGTRALLKQFDAFFVDEGHQVPAATYAAVCEAVPAYYRFVLSAAPFERSDGNVALILGLFGGLIYEKTDGELADPAKVHEDDRARVPAGEAYLPKTIIRMVRHQQAAFFLGTWPEAYRLQIVKSATRNHVVVNMALAAAKPVLVLYSDVKYGHGVEIANRLRRAGLRVTFVDSKLSEQARKKVIDDANAKRIDAVVASRVFNVGIDIPELAAVVNAAGDKAAQRTIQRGGRVKRKTRTKKVGEVWDVYDWTFGKKRAKGIWVAKHARARVMTYRKQGHEVWIGETVDGPWTVLPPMLPSKRKASKAKEQAKV